MKKVYKFGILFLLVISILVLTVVIEKNASVPENTSNINEASNQEELNPQYNISTYVTEEIKNKAEISSAILCLAYEYTPEKMYELATDIAIVKVISLDYMNPSQGTFGKILINNSLSGSLKEGEIVTYLEPGGYVNMEEWDKVQPEASREKRRYLREQAGLSTDYSQEWIYVTADIDIEIEAGKTYLAYLAYNDELECYEIIGLENGLREVNIPQEMESVSVTELNFNELKIKNNVTEEYENLNEYVVKNIES